MRGLAKYQLKLNKEALTDFKEAVKLNPQDATFLTNLGRTKIELQDYKGAITDLEKAITLNPDDGYAYTNLGLIKYKTKKYNQALLHLNRAISLSPDLAESYSIRSNMKTALKDKKGAQEDIDIYFNLTAVDEMANGVYYNQVP